MISVTLTIGYTGIEDYVVRTNSQNSTAGSTAVTLLMEQFVSVVFNRLLRRVPFIKFIFSQIRPLLIEELYVLPDVQRRLCNSSFEDAHLQIILLDYL